MKPIILFCAWAAVSLVHAATPPLERLETQFKSDLQAILVKRWTAQEVLDQGPMYLDTWFTELKTAYPTLLAVEADPAIPTDEQLSAAQAEALRLYATKEKGEIWNFYQDYLQRKLLSADQKVIFGRFLAVITTEAKEKLRPEAQIREAQGELRKIESELQRLKAQKE